MRESGEWFSPRSSPETLTSDDPPVPNDKPELVRILPGPATAAGRPAAPLRRLVALVPALGRRLVRVDDEPTRWQLVGLWATGSAIVAGTGLAVATILGGAPPALTQPFERLSVLPGISTGSSSGAGGAPPATGVPAPPGGGATTPPQATDPPPVTDPTEEPPADTGTPTEPPPTEQPTDPAPTDAPTRPDTTPADPPAQSPTYQPNSPPADPPVVETPPADPTPTAEASTAPADPTPPPTTTP
jgi:hypothetical protein